jgi:hypothetical protein
MSPSILCSLLTACAAALAVAACDQTPSPTAPSATATQAPPAAAPPPSVASTTASATAPAAPGASGTAPAASATTVYGPTVSTSTAASGSPFATPTSSSPSGVASTGPGGASTVPAQYRACRADADCVAVPREGCCKNGWKEAVAATQKDAYHTAFACTMHPAPMCPMYMVNDTRVPKCDAQQHLCVMVQP